MKRWLVGLVAAGLCAASAWAETNTVAYFVRDKAVTVMQGEAPEGSSASYHQTNNGTSGQATGGTRITLTLTGYEGTTVTGLRLAMHSNSKAGAGSLSATCGDAVIGSIADAPFNDPSWYGAWSQIFVDVTVPVVPTVIDDDISITIAASSNSLYCEEFYIDYIPAVPKFSVSLDPGADFTVVLDTPTDIRAMVENATGSVDYAWTLDGEPLDVLGDTFTVDASVSGGPHEVVCVATDTGTGATAEAAVSYTVVAAYTVTVADGIGNGSVAVWDGETELANPADVLEGTTLKVVATPATRSYKVESITVTGEESGEIALENGEFAMPSENVFVTATFAERTQTAYSLVESMDDFEVGADYLIVACKDGSYTSALKNEYQSESDGRIAVEEVEIDGNAVETEDDSIVWTISAGSSEGQYTIYNATAAKFVSAPATSNLNSALLVNAGTAAAQWTLEIAEDTSLATIGSIYEGKSLQRNEKANNAYFANYKGGTKPYLFKKVGTGVFSVALDPGEDFDVIRDEEAGIAATPRNAVGEVTYAWTVDGVAAETDGPVLPLSTGELGEHVVVCVATDGGAEGVTAQATVSYTVVAATALYTVTIADGIENGSVALNLDGFPIEPPIELPAGTEVTVEATPDAGFALAAITVNGTPLIEGNTFVVEGDSEVSATFVESSVKFATYTVASKSAVETTGEVPEGSEATFECNGYSATQLTGGTRMTLTLKGYEGATITGLTLSMHSNGRTGAGSVSAVSGETLVGGIVDAPFSDASWNGSFTLNWVDIVVPVTATVVGEDVVIVLEASANSLYCESFTVEYEPRPPAFSVTLEPAGDFDAILGEEASVLATALNAAGEVTYAWTVDGVAAETDGPVLALSTDEVGGPHEVVCVATDGGAEGVTAEARVSYTVVETLEMYTVTIAGGIENGSVALNLDGFPIEAPIALPEGTEVTVEAVADDGYETETVTVNGDFLVGTTFVVAGDSEVSATFVPLKDFATLPFLGEDTPFTGPWQNAKVAGVTGEGLGTDYNTAADGRGARFDDTGDRLQIKFEGAPDELSYALKGQGTSATNVSTFDVWESVSGGEGTWTSVASHKSGENLFNGVKTNFTAELKADSRFVKFAYTEKGLGNVALYDVYISGRAFSVSFDKKDGFTVERGTADSITATVRNGEEPCYFMWSCEQAAALNAEDEGLCTLVIPATLEAGDYTVVLDVFDAQGETASKTISFGVVEPPAKYPVSIDIGILNGNVVADVPEAAEGDTVTLTATPDPGYKLGTITVAYGEETLEFTASPATFEMPAAEVLVGASFVERGDEFAKITDLEDLEEGEYVITGAAPDGEYAMLAELVRTGTPHIKQKETPEEIEGGAIAGPGASIVWSLAKTDDGWTIHNDNVGFVGYLASGNSAGAEEEATKKSTWTISASNGLFLVRNVGNAGRYLFYNAGATRFACYTSPDSSITPLAFYKKSGPAVFAVSVDGTGFELTQGEAATVTATARNGAEPYSFVWTSGTGALDGVEGPELAIPGTLEPGDYSATVTATDSSAEPQTATAEVTFKVVAPPPVYTVTVADGIENGTVTVDKTEAEEGETVTVTATPDENYKLVAILVNGIPLEGNTFEIEGDSVVSAEFTEIVLYPVTIDDAIEHGSIEADMTEAEEGETVTLAATPDDGWKLDMFLLNGVPFGGNTFAMPAGEALVSAVFAETVQVTFVPVESEAEFVVGEEYLLVAYKEDAYTSAMKNAANGTRIGVDEVEIAEDGSIATDNADIVWTIRAGAGENRYVLFNEIGGVYAAGPDSEGNNAQLVTDGTAALAQWSLDFSALPEVKIASASYGGRFLQRNGDKNNPFFATYTGDQVHPILFKKAEFTVGFDKEDGFTVEAGTADSITATALRGTGPYGYVWTGDLEGEGATLAIPADLAEGEYAVTVTATDSSYEPHTATASISFTVVAKYAVTVTAGIVGGEVTVDKERAAAGETVTVTATPDSGHSLGAITVDGEPIGGNTFEMPARDVEVSARFDEVVDYATLPFVAPDTPYSGPWKDADVAGLTRDGLDSDYTTDGVLGAKFRTTGAWMQIKFRGTPGTLSFGIKGNGTSATNVSTFAVLESADGETWTDVAVFASDDNLANARRDVRFTLAEDSRYVKFLYREKGDGNVGIYDVYIAEAGEPEPAVTVTGDTTLRLGETFELVLALENYAGGEYTWTNNVPFGSIDADTATFWWTPPRTGEFPVTFSAMDGERTIASADVMLTVVGEPALVFDGDDEGTVGTPANFTVVAENVADPTVTFMGFLEVPEGSALTDADVILDFPNVTFTPDVAGDYGLAFSAGTPDVDHVEDLWIVTVAAAPAEPEVTLVDGETTVELGDYFVLEFALSNYEGEFFWITDVGEIDEDGLFTWTPIEAGEFPVAVSAVYGEETIASTTVTLTVSDEPPLPVPAAIKEMVFDTETGTVLLRFKGDGTAVYGTDDLNGEWQPVEGADVEGDTATVPMTVPFLRVQ